MTITPLNTTGVSVPGANAQDKTTSANPISASVTNTVTKEDTKASKGDVTSAVNKLQDFATSNGVGIHFSQDDDTGKVIVKVIDKDTDKVIRQIPSEEAIAISKSITKMTGLLFDKKA